MSVLCQSEVEKEVLELACEDYYGLYEIIWTLNASHPEISESEKIACATLAVQSLLNRGWIQLYSSEWPSQSHKLLSSSELRSISLSDDIELWQPSEQNISFAATDAGEKFG